MTTPTPPRRWFRYSLATLFVVVTVAAVLIAILPYPLTQDRTEAIKQEAIAEVTRRTGVLPNHLEATVTKNGDDYAVLVLRLPATVGGHYLLIFSKDGTLKDFEGGA